MKKLILITIAALIGFSANAATLKAETIQDQGITRTYYMYIPDGLPGGAPLMFVLHGYGGSANGYLSGYYKLADEFGFALCYPQATVDPKGKNGWNVSYPWQIGAMKVDDCQFILNLKESLIKKYGFSSKNVFFTGNSNGGEMCYLMAMRYPNEFAAIASMYGLVILELLKEYDFTVPVNFMELHGTGDTTSRWVGDPTNKYGWGAYMAVPLAVGCVVAVNKCTVEETEVLPIIKNKVTKHSYKGSPYGKEVIFYEVQNGNHGMATDSFDSYRAVFEFFNSHVEK